MRHSGRNDVVNRRVTFSGTLPGATPRADILTPELDLPTLKFRQLMSNSGVQRTDFVPAALAAFIISETLLQPHGLRYRLSLYAIDMGKTSGVDLLPGPDAQRFTPLNYSCYGTEALPGTSSDWRLNWKNASRHQRYDARHQNCP